MEVCIRKPNSNGLKNQGDLLAFPTEKLQRYDNDWLRFNESFGISLSFFWNYSPQCWLYPQAGSKITVVIPGFTFTRNTRGRKKPSLLVALLKVRKRLSSKPQQTSLLILGYQQSQAFISTSFLTTECHGLFGLG